jgi:uncharacterized membrane protein YeaQ/YmgE (transglycosylase-associated protein family)
MHDYYLGFEAQTLLYIIIVGIVAGFLAGKIMKGSGFGLLGDLVVGVVGAVLGGFVFGLIGLHGSGYLGEILIAVIGACLLLWLVRRIKR